jgi:hypothetical protein
MAAIDDMVGEREARGADWGATEGSWKWAGENGER